MPSLRLCIEEKDIYGLKDNPNHEPKRPSTSRRRKEHVPKPMTLDKDPFEMDKIKKLLQRMSNDMVDLKRENGDNQGNNRGLAGPPPRRPYQAPLNQPPLNPGETLNLDEIYSIVKSLTYVPPNTQNDDKHEIAKIIPPNNEPDPSVNIINCFSKLPMAE